MYIWLARSFWRVLWFLSQHLFLIYWKVGVWSQIADLSALLSLHVWTVSGFYSTKHEFRAQKQIEWSLISFIHFKQCHCHSWVWGGIWFMCDILWTIVNGTEFGNNNSSDSGAIGKHTGFYFTIYWTYRTPTISWSESTTNF